MGSEKKSEARIRKIQDDLASIIKEITSESKIKQRKKMLMTENIGLTMFKVAVLLCGTGLVFSIITALFMTRNISRSMKQLKAATKQISEGKFEYTSESSRRDELGDLSRSFVEMAKRLKRLEGMYLDANPLTRLPGGIAIEKEIAVRLSTGASAAFCFADLDNFKAFNDRYSYARGSELIKATARLIEEVIAEKGSRQDFIGHIGGDDYVFISSLLTYVDICNTIIERFDSMIIDFYDLEDVKRGSIISKNRRDEEMQFPIMTISIAVITKQQNEIINAIKIGEIAAELKNYAKSIPVSVWVSERRHIVDGMEHGEKIMHFPGGSA